MSSYEDREARANELFWSTVKTAIVAVAVFATLTIVQYNVTYFNAFNNCVNAGKTPGNFAIPGNDRAQFMCLPNDSSLIVVE